MKLHIYLNRIPENYNFKDDMEQARLYHLKHGVEWQITYHIVDIHGYSNFYDTYKNRWVLRGVEVLIPQEGEINMFVFDQKEWEIGNGRLKPEAPTGDVQMINGKPFVCIPTYLSDHLSGYTRNCLEHEPMHCYVQLAKLSGIIVQDVMDITNGQPYFHNEDPDYPNGNFAQQWILLQPYLNSLKQPLTATLTRLYDYGRETVGKLESGTFSCNTLELGFHQNQTNISSIPNGTYQVKWTFSPRFLKSTYEIQNVPNRSGIRIHPSNLYSQLLGCIALGRGYDNLDGDMLPDILNSRQTVADFEWYMGRKEFLLIIK